MLAAGGIEMIAPPRRTLGNTTNDGRCRVIGAAGGSSKRIFAFRIRPRGHALGATHRQLCCFVRFAA